MEDESDAVPPIHIDELLAQLWESKAQAERGDCVSAETVLAEMRRRFEARFPPDTSPERKASRLAG